MAIAYENYTGYKTGLSAYEVYVEEEELANRVPLTRAAWAQATIASRIESANTLSDLLADTLITYSLVNEGDILTARDGTRLEVAAVGASDNHEAGAGSVKMYEAGPLFTTRARLRHAIGTRSRTWSDGTILSDGEFDYISSAGATDIGDLPGLLPAKDLRPEHFGYDDGRGPGTVFVELGAYAAAQATALGRDIVIKLRGHYSGMDQTIDLTEPANAIHFVGDGDGVSVLNPASFGRTKKFIDAEAGSSTVGRVRSHPTFRNVMFEGNSDVDDPIMVYAPWSNTWTWENVQFIGCRNTVFWTKEIDNCQISVLEVASCGYQPLQKENDAIVYYGASGTTVTAYSNTSGTPIPGYFSGMTGAVLYLGGADDTQVAFDNPTVFPTTISAVTGDGSTCTVADSVPVAVVAADGNVLSFGPLLCDTTASNNIITLDFAGILSSEDVGRQIFLHGVGSADRADLLHTEIVAVSGTSVTLSDPPLQAKSGIEVWLAPPIVISSPFSERDPGEITNDFTVTHARIEQFQGPAFLMSYGKRVYLKAKTHGLGPSKRDFGTSRHCLAIYGASDIDFTGPMEMAFTPNSGRILMSGGSLFGSFAVQDKPRPDWLHMIHVDTNDADTRIHLRDVLTTADMRTSLIKATTNGGANTALRLDNMVSSGLVTIRDTSRDDIPPLLGISRADAFVGQRFGIDPNGKVIYDLKALYGTINLATSNSASRNLQAYLQVAENTLEEISKLGVMECGYINKTSDAFDAVTDVSPASVGMFLTNDGKIVVGSTRTITVYATITFFGGATGFL